MVERDDSSRPVTRARRRITVFVVVAVSSLLLSMLLSMLGTLATITSAQAALLRPTSSVAPSVDEPTVVSGADSAPAAGRQGPQGSPVPGAEIETLDPSAAITGLQVTLPDALPPGSPEEPRSLFDTGGAENPSLPTEMSRDERGRFILPAEAIGFGPAVRLTGSTAKKRISFPVPLGLTPVAILADAQSAPDVTRGFLEFGFGNRPATTIDLKRSADRGKVVQIRVPLRPGDTLRNQLAFDVTSSLEGHTDPCRGRIVGLWLDLAHLSIVFEGQPAGPSTVADFFPLYMDGLVIRMPAKPTFQELTAVMTVAASAAAQSATSGLRISTSSLTSPVPDPSTTERIVEVSEHFTAGLELTDAATTGTRHTKVLRVGGSEGRVIAAARMFEGSYRILGQSPFVSTSGVPIEPLNTKNRRTLTDLGIGTIEVSGNGTLEAAFGLSQTMFAGSAKAVTLRLRIAHTAVPERGDATTTLIVNGQILATALLHEKAEASFDVVVPPEILRRELAVVVRTDYTPPGGLCREGLFPFTFQVLGGSRIDIIRGLPEEPGLNVFPQALAPDFGVGIADPSLATTEIAARLVAVLQKASNTPLRPLVLPFATAYTLAKAGETKSGSETSAPAPTAPMTPDGIPLATNAAIVLIAAATPPNVGLHPPLAVDPLRVLVGAADERIRFAISSRFSVIEADVAGERPRLNFLWSASGRGLAESMLDQLSVRRTNWTSLDGDTFLKTDASPAVDMNLRRKALPLGQTRSSTPITARIVGLLKVIALLVTAIVIGLILRSALLRRKRRRALEPRRTPEQPSG